MSNIVVPDRVSLSTSWPGFKLGWRPHCPNRSFPFLDPCTCHWSRKVHSVGKAAHTERARIDPPVPPPCPLPARTLPLSPSPIPWQSASSNSWFSPFSLTYNAAGASLPAPALCPCLPFPNAMPHVVFPGHKTTLTQLWRTTYAVTR